MDDGLGAKIKIVPDYFQVSASSEDTPQRSTSSDQVSTSEDTPIRSASSNLQPRIDNQSWSRSPSWTGRKLKRAALMLNFFSLRSLPWSSGSGSEKIELTRAELESLRSELADIEEREAHLKAQLEHVDEILRSARLSGYLHIRTRWAALPGEPPPLDDTEVDDWLPRFLVLHGHCIFFYLLSTDMSPQDSTLLPDVVEVSSLPSFTREDDQTWYSFYILTRHGLRFECSSTSKIQVDSWLTALQTDCKKATDG